MDNILNSNLLKNSMLLGDKTETELDSAWAEIAVMVREGNFEGYEAAYHPDAVVVNGLSESCYPISKALANWKQGFIDTKAGYMTTDVSFRFSKRLHDEDTAYETGMFYYLSVDSRGKQNHLIAHMNSLMLKKSGKWLIMMEFQKSKATLDEWNRLK